MLLGMQIMFALGLMGFLGLWYVSGNGTALQIVRMCVFDSVANYFFCVVPFFVMMGFLCFRSGMSVSLYEAGRKIFGQLPGGLAIGTVFGCAGFASICGDSMATAGTMGSVSYPEMKKYKYKDSLATSCVAAGGTLGILIPPSMGFIVYGLIAEVSIGKLFVAGIIPGILLALFFSIIIIIRCKINTSLGPPGPKVPLMEKLLSLKDVWPILVLFIVVIGGIYMGVFTPTEGGGIGTLVALLIGLAKRSLSFKDLIRACIESMALTSVIFGILIGVTILGYFITISEIPMRLASIIVALPLSRWAIFIVILILYVVLGMVMNIIPMILITLPILFPTIVGLGFDPIWFGVVMVIMMEMGQITPPVGVNVFVIASVAKGVSMSSIFKGVAPFILAMIFIIILLAIFPDLALFLPNSMNTLAPIGQ
jgi:tripartite ATP-independent transporter DctM subunit